VNQFNVGLLILRAVFGLFIAYHGYNKFFGPGGLRVMEWFFPTDTFQKMQKKSGETGIDNDFSAKSMTGMGAWILGRNMFGPIRGPWPDDSWKGWWGDNPPYHTPVFVLTNHPRYEALAAFMRTRLEAIAP